MATPVDGTHEALGRTFRTPAHPVVVEALGRVLYNFLSLEESVTAVLFDADYSSLPEARGKMAGAKESELKNLADVYQSSSDPRAASVAGFLDAAVGAFRCARQRVRNEVLHAHPFTAGTDEAGAYLPGLAYTSRDGSSWKTLARKPEDLLDLAADVESAINPLSAAREAVRSLPVTSLQG